MQSCRARCQDSARVYRPLSWTSPIIPKEIMYSILSNQYSSEERFSLDFISRNWMESHLLPD